MTGHSSFPVERGMALVLVLWIVAALAVFASSLGGVVRQEAAVGGVSRNLATGRAAGEAAIYLALQRMATRPEALREPVLEPVTLPGGQIVEVEVVPWSGLVDINGATPELLAVLFRHAAGRSRGAAMAMAQTVRQARDAMRQQSGSAAGGWEAPEDLLQVPGMTYGIYASIRDFVVADSGNRQGINPNAAPQPLRGWLESAGGAVPAQQGLSGTRYAITARVLFEGAGMVAVRRMVNVRSGAGVGRLPWSVLSASQSWIGKI